MAYCTVFPKLPNTPNLLGIANIILPVLKFVVFYLAPFLLLLWSTSPDLWSNIFSLVCLVSDDPSSLLHLLSGLLISGEALVKSLTCNNLELYSSDHALLTPLAEELPVSLSLHLESNNLVSL
ncbi:hypothetical protein DSO57_1000761 [Entomophthora muscae]|uniref:Uncharacterized protein n=1 Tax=Entomophthora muscae TaxID=34485 RepID=A0ACC2T948_9FUNG|nr:hypothetical protein DSO57_1000761 [Entomophthora muscae]